ncbi:MAG: prolipoprotein diacylglyceryl transferase, partial [Oscillospiraceae bacterium]|nr:prolipoprotein diacylglyceryl transferase [Oscillospiraceae bacterium]
LGRVFIEGLRTDSLMVGHLRISQLVAGLCVIASIAVIIAMRHKIKMDGEYVFYKDTDEFRQIIAETEEKYKAEEEKRAAKKAAKSKDAELRPEDRLVDEEDEENPEKEENNNGKNN